MALLRVETVRELFGYNVEQKKQSYLPVSGPRTAGFLAKFGSAIYPLSAETTAVQNIHPSRSELQWVCRLLPTLVIKNIGRA